MGAHRWILSQPDTETQSHYGVAPTDQWLKLLYLWRRPEPSPLTPMKGNEPRQPPIPGETLRRLSSNLAWIYGSTMVSWRRGY